MNHQLSPEDLTQIKALLSSNQDENNELVFNILEGYGLIPNEVQDLLNNRYKYKVGEKKYTYKGGENILDVRVRRNEIHFYLDLKDQQLTALPKRIGRIKNLKEVNVSQNKLLELPKELIHLTELEKLSIAYNREMSKDCFKIICQLKKLKVLNISGCSLNVFPEELLTMKNLEVIYLKGNELSALPPQISTLENLYYIDLSRNHFTKFPYHLYNMPSLETLVFEYNRFTQAQITALKRSKKDIKITF